MPEYQYLSWLTTPVKVCTIVYVSWLIFDQQFWSKSDIWKVRDITSIGLVSDVEGSGYSLWLSKITFLSSSTIFYFLQIYLVITGGPWWQAESCIADEWHVWHVCSPFTRLGERLQNSELTRSISAEWSIERGNQHESSVGTHFDQWIGHSGSSCKPLC